MVVNYISYNNKQRSLALLLRLKNSLMKIFVFFFCRLFLMENNLILLAQLVNSPRISPKIVSRRHFLVRATIMQ